jgi:hypothetical protein
MTTELEMFAQVIKFAPAFTFPQIMLPLVIIPQVNELEPALIVPFMLMAPHVIDRVVPILKLVLLIFAYSVPEPVAVPPAQKENIEPVESPPIKRTILSVLFAPIP